MLTSATFTSSTSLSRHRAKVAHPARTIRKPALLLASIALLAGGCDRQNGPDPQGTAGGAAATVAGSPPAEGSPVPRYRVDRSNAGAPLPAGNVTDATGATTTLSSLVGKPILLNLWATWCAPCVEELPTLNLIARANAGTAHVIALSQDLGDRSVGEQFLTARSWTQIVPWHDPENAIGLSYGGALPTTILFGADGRETARVIGPLDWTGDDARVVLEEAGLAAR